MPLAQGGGSAAVHVIAWGAFKDNTFSYASQGNNIEPQVTEEDITGGCIMQARPDDFTKAGCPNSCFTVRHTHGARFCHTTSTWQVRGSLQMQSFAKRLVPRAGVAALDKTGLRKLTGIAPAHHVLTLLWRGRKGWSSGREEFNLARLHSNAFSILFLNTAKAF